jgi:aspartyl/asparaginyl-tRNA synthetase
MRPPFEKRSIANAFSRLSLERVPESTRADILLGNGEVLSLGERHISSEEVRIALKQHEVLEEPYKWYMDMRDQKEIKTTGWGMGIERFLAWVFKHDDIRNLVVMPRMKGTEFSVYLSLPSLLFWHGNPGSDRVPDS